MSYLQKMTTRLNSSGSGSRNAIVNSSIDTVNRSFTDALSYKLVQVDGTNTDAIVQSADLPDMKIVLFRPGRQVNRGQYITFDGTTWIVTDFKSHEVYPKAVIQRCNEILRWIDSQNIKREYPCVLNANSTLYRFGFVPDRYMNIVNNEYHVFVGLSANTSVIKENFRFVFGKKAYYVTAVDDVTMTIGGVGLIRYHIKADLKRDADVNDIADNSRQEGGVNKLW